MADRSGGRGNTATPRRASRRARAAALAVLPVAVLAASACSSDATEPVATRASTTPPREPEPGPSFGTRDEELVARLMQSDDDRPFFMVNLIELRDHAVYADGRETDLTGEEANDRYTETGVPLLVRAGMRPAMFGTVDADAASPPVPAWDQVAIARYPSYAAFFAVTSDARFQAGAEHKDAGVETSTVIVTHRVVDAPPAAELPAASAPAMLFELFAHTGSGTSDRPGSLSAYLEGLAPLVTANGGVALGTYEVVGALIGDGRAWDEAHVWWFPDRSALDAVLSDPELAALTAARDADLEDHYRLPLRDVAVEPMGREP